ncbi:MAG TPA: hypothetical protein VE593_00170, partial [Nitrososphaeraceae archaeon]|nr:hypothetical protein [Nitrososphaeraceae archaeon]
GNILFGLAFFIVAKNVISFKVKDYLTISAIGFTVVGISLSTSALQQTYGVAAHSLVLLSSYLFSIGLYVSALSVSQDSSLRKMIRKSTTDLVYNIGSAQMEQQIESTVRKVIQNQQKELELQTGGYSHEVSEDDVKDYVQSVINERSSSGMSISQKAIKTDQVPSPIADSPTKSSAPSSAEAGKVKHNTTIEGLVTSFRLAGATVQIPTQNTSVNQEPSDWKKVEALKINGYDVRIFEYKDDQAAADAVTKRAALDGTSEYRVNVTTSKSHIYRAANLVALYLGDDLATINILESVFGKEISAAAISSNKDVEAEAARLAKEMEEKETKEQELR